jgi:hypothetical protein
VTRPSRRVADYAPSTLNFSAELVLAAAVEEAVALLRSRVGRVPGYDIGGKKYAARVALSRAGHAADLILGRAR